MDSALRELATNLSELEEALANLVQVDLLARYPQEQRAVIVADQYVSIGAGATGQQNIFNALTNAFENAGSTDIQTIKGRLQARGVGFLNKVFSTNPKSTSPWVLYLGGDVIKTKLHLI